MSTSESATTAHEPGRLSRMLSALRPHPLRRKAHQEVTALSGGVGAFAERYGLDRAVTDMAELNAAAESPALGDAELAEQLRLMVEQAREYLHQLESGKLPQEIPDFVEMVEALESGGSSSAAGLAACAELAGLLRKIDKLDNHWLAEARRKRRLGGAPRHGRDANRDNIDDNVQQPRRNEGSQTRDDHQLSGVSAKTLMAHAARRRDELAERLERERLEADLDDDEDPDASVEFWSRYGEEIALLLVALGYCSEGTQVLGSSRVAELMGLPPGVPPFELLERLRGEFEGRYLPIDADYDPRIVHAVTAGMPVAEAIALNERDLLGDNGVPEIAPAAVPDGGVRVQAARASFGTPLGIATRAPWQPADPAEIARDARFGPDV